MPGAGAVGDQLVTELTSHSERQKVGSRQPLNLSPDQQGSQRPLVGSPAHLSSGPGKTRG